MFRGGVLTVYVSDMDAAVKFYTETLGFRLLERHGNYWASLDGPGLTIGLHPATPTIPAGRQGSMAIGLYIDGPIADAVAALEAKGARFTSPIIDDKALSLAYLSDPDGNLLYLAEMKPAYR